MLTVIKSVMCIFARQIGLWWQPPQRRTLSNRAATPSVLYAFRCRGEGSTGAITETFKVGKTVNLQQRIRPYRTIFPSGTVYHSVPSRDIDTTERWLHDVLKMQGYHVTKEIFQAPPDTVKELMNVVVDLNEAFLRCGKDVQKLRRMGRSLRRM